MWFPDAPPPPASFSSCARRFMMDLSYTFLKHTVNYFMASSTITRSADYWSVFRSSRCLRRETFTCLSLAENNNKKFIIWSLHTPGAPPTVESPGHPPPHSVPEMCVSMCVPHQKGRDLSTRPTLKMWSLHLKIREPMKLTKKGADVNFTWCFGSIIIQMLFDSFPFVVDQ